MSTVLLAGGPRDGTTLDVGEASLVTLNINGLTHRYIRSGERREVNGESLPVYPYDGEVRQDEGVVQHDTRNQGEAPGTG
ncbi:hypothetical protein [Rhizomonospora bruguierae]|uniref:hypothetical protein n=1 Tax=Rhizomonospora bruguierae TaxID=1581705 RepID=UPI001BCB27D4|nr:hypothetical protein [Micromonospora sp. NBRC 107566]